MKMCPIAVDFLDFARKAVAKGGHGHLCIVRERQQKSKVRERTDFKDGQGYRSCGMLYKGKGRTSRGASRERKLSRSAATSIREPG